MGGDAEMAPEPLEAPSESDQPEGVKKRKLWVLGLRILVSVGMLAFLIYKIDDEGGEDLIPKWTATSTAWFIGALTCTLLGIGLSALRWKAVLRALGQRPRLQRLMSIYLAGQFVANVLPTSIGGDALRVTRESRDSGEPHTSFASVVLERLTGWIVLPVITLVGFAVNPGLRGLNGAFRLAAGMAVGTLILLGVVLFLVSRHDYEAVIDNPKGWRRFLGAVSFGLHQLRHQPAAAAEVIGVGFVYQLVLVLAALMGSRALGIPSSEVGFTALMAFIPAVLIAQVLPISISGLGIREGLLVLFLKPLGVSEQQAIALGLMLYLLNLVVSLLGAPSFAVGHRAQSPSQQLTPTA